MVARAELGTLTPLADPGSVASEYHTSYRLPEQPAALTFIQLDPYLDEEAGGRSEHDVTEAIRFRQSLDTPSRARLDSIASWPLEKVTDSGRTVGWLVEGDPEEFLLDSDPPRSRACDARSCWSGCRPRRCRPPSPATVPTGMVHPALGSPGEPRVRGRDAPSARNGLRGSEPSECGFFGPGCASPPADATRWRRSQIQGADRGTPPFSSAPECRPSADGHARGNPHLLDQATDVYKLGLCIVRAMSMGQGSAQVRTTDHLGEILDGELMAAVNGALSADPSARPSARALYSELSRCIGRLTEPPEIADFGAVSTAVPRGTDLVFTWKVRNATAAYLHGPNGFSMPVDPAWGYCAVAVPQSGVFRLEASDEE